MAELSARVGFALLCRKKIGRSLGRKRRALPEFRVEGDGPLVPLAGLKLHRISLVQVVELKPRRNAPAVKKYFIPAVVGNDEPETLLPHHLFDRSHHWRVP